MSFYYLKTQIMQAVHHFLIPYYIILAPWSVSSPNGMPFIPWSVSSPNGIPFIPWSVSSPTGMLDDFYSLVGVLTDRSA